MHVSRDERTRADSVSTGVEDEGPSKLGSSDPKLLQSQRLESIGQLAAGIAHEINTPMQFVKDNIEYLSDSLEKLFCLLAVYDNSLSTEGAQRPWEVRAAKTREQRSKLGYERIRSDIPHAIVETLEGINRIIDIVKAMQQFSHPGHDEREDVDLNTSVQNCVAITRNRWKNVAEMRLDLDPYMPLIPSGPSDFGQVLLNLIINAADAIIDRGEFDSELGAISVRTRYQPGTATLEVSDTGCGIPDDVRLRIFDPFFTTKEVGKGTGQGLTICYSIVVQKSGGSIEVESNVGHGTKFTITIPVKSGDNAFDREAAAESFASSIPAFAD